MILGFADTVGELVGFLLGWLLTVGDPVGIELGLIDIVGALLGDDVSNMLRVDDTVGDCVTFFPGLLEIVDHSVIGFATGLLLEGCGETEGGSLVFVIKSVPFAFGEIIGHSVL